MAENKRDTSKKRNSILEAALQGFRDEGYENISMDRIAELAGASKRTVYNHFPSKEILFQAVVDRFMEEVSSLKQIPYDPDRPVEEQLLGFAEAKVGLLENPAWRGLVKVAMGVFVREPEIAEQTMARAEAGGDTLISWLHNACADGKLAVDSEEVAAEIFWGMVSGVLFWPQIFQGSIDRQHLDRLKKEIVRTFVARYRPQ